ncbi:uncharacterized protein V6R79_013090 [Siganus canaliculatus]
MASTSALRLHSMCIISAVISRWLSLQQISLQEPAQDSHACIMIIQLLFPDPGQINNADGRTRTIDGDEKNDEKFPPGVAYPSVLTVQL